ncbi:SDR family oxidoreductase [Actinoplanes sp. HUAS TT8]|uniref:SDR family oxidoreductase n=1 Tax=Actinoplanes sp. HUAS TT8 TaxID=3447453 RepID=UPI003F5207DA
MDVLITGAGQGIGLGLATRFLASGHRVLITGRSAEKLERATAAHPGLLTFRNDIGRPEERERLAEHVRATMPDLQVLVNNAGIQRRIGLATDDAAWAERQAEIDILLAGPVHLNHLLIPTMLGHGRPCSIVNVTSGGAFVPQPFAPLYSACKAALHSYTINLRHSLSHTPCRVVELIPPAVATGLAGPDNTHGTPLDTFCDAVYPALLENRADEIGYGMTDSPAFKAQNQAAAATYDRFASRFPVDLYETTSR